MSSAEFVAINPFDLPEIRELLKNYLPRRALVRCIRVNRAWHASFLPSIWEDISLFRLTPGYEIGPSPELVNSHRHLIRSLSFHETIERAYSSRAFPSLGSLRLFDISPTSRLPPEDEKQIERSVVEILTLNRTLVQLTLRETGPDWQAISELKNLKVLELISCDKVCSTPRFWSICTQLETLILANANVPDLRHLPNDAVFEKLRTLDMLDMRTLSDRDQIELVFRCPNLEMLQMNTNQTDQGMSAAKEFACMVKAGALPNLRDLQYTHSGLSQDDIHALLQTIQRCTRWRVPKTAFGSTSFLALSKHFSTLTDLDLEDCKTVSSEMIQTILSSCPLLTAFRGGRIDAKDIVEGQPWVCKSLKCLNAFIHFEPLTTADDVSPPPLATAGGSVVSKTSVMDDDRLQRGVFEKLSTLHNLAVLIVGSLYGCHMCGQSRYCRGLDFRLSKGLGLLSTLKKIGYLKFSGTAQILGEEDLQWMLDQWKRLLRVEGTLNHVDEKIRLKLERFLRGHCVWKND